MFFDLNPYFVDSVYTPHQQVQIFEERVFFAQRVIKAPSPTTADNVLPIRRFSSLGKKANSPVSKFDREFFI